MVMSNHFQYKDLVIIQLKQPSKNCCLGYQVHISKIYAIHVGKYSIHAAYGSDFLCASFVSRDRRRHMTYVPGLNTSFYIISIFMCTIHIYIYFLLWDGHLTFNHRESL